MPTPYNRKFARSGKMPFGKYKGVPFDDVPCSELYSLIRYHKRRNYPDLDQYLRMNYARIEAEHDELVSQRDFFAKEDNPEE